MKWSLVAVAASVMLSQALPLSAGAQALSLTQPAPIASGSASLPRISAPATPATAKVDAALAQLDAKWRTFLHGCGRDTGPPGTGRTVAVVMAAPTVLSLDVTEDISCGGAYPDEDTIALAYDLTTGRPLDWTKLAPSIVQSTTIDTTTDGTRIGAVVSTQLHALYLKLAKADSRQDADLRNQCADVWADDGLAFQLWPDARQDAVVVMPFGLPHAAAACAFAEPIKTADLRTLGVNAALLGAIDAAHAAR